MPNNRSISDLLDSLDYLAATYHPALEPGIEEKLRGRIDALARYLRIFNLDDLAEALPSFPMAKGELLPALELLHNFIVPEARRRIGSPQEVDFTFWEQLHPRISEIAEVRFKSGHFADSVEAALKEVNVVVKALVRERTGLELDGARLMNRAFSLENPIIRLADLSTESGKSEQVGYMQIFSGAMVGVRNPAAHANRSLEELEAIHLLYLASLLMYRVEYRLEEEAVE